MNTRVLFDGANVRLSTWRPVTINVSEVPDAVRKLVFLPLEINPNREILDSQTLGEFSKEPSEGHAFITWFKSYYGVQIPTDDLDGIENLTIGEIVLRVQKAIRACDQAWEQSH